MEATIVKKIGKYEVTGILGRGGMGVVYRAEDKRIGRQVAIKTLTEGYTGQPDMLERFYREAQAGILHHPNIVIVYDLGDENGIPMIIMEYVPGEPLDKLIASGRKLRLAEKLGIIEQVCAGLAYAHRHGVVHRDIKPANVIVQPDGHVKIVDFGIARLHTSNTDTGLTVAGSVIGTVHYVAPERLKGERFDGRSDIFSTGVMLYLLLTGQLPFAGEPLTAMHKLVYEPFPPLKNFLSTYPEELDAILDRAMAKDPDQRYATADEFANDLGGLRQQLDQARVSELFSDAERLTTEQQFGQARDMLLQLTRIDAQHTGARQLLGIVQQHLSRMQRADQVKQFAAEAEQALESGRLPEAIATLQQAAKLDPSSATVQLKLGAAKDKKQRQEEISSLLTEAEASRGRGDLTGALRALEKALPLDPDNSRLRSAHAIVVKEAKLAEQRRRVRGMLDQARQEISVRHYTQAIEILRETSQIDPSEDEVGPLLQSAMAGQEQERRRKLLQEVHGEVEVCLASEDFERAREFLSYGLQRASADASLLQLQAQVEEQARAARQQQLSQENARHTRELEFVNFQVTQLRSGGDLNEAIRFLQSQPPAITGEPRIEQLLRELQKEREIEQATPAARPAPAPAEPVRATWRPPSVGETAVAAPELPAASAPTASGEDVAEKKNTLKFVLIGGAVVLLAVAIGVWLLKAVASNDAANAGRLQPSTQTSAWATDQQIKRGARPDSHNTSAPAANAIAAATTPPIDAPAAAPAATPPPIMPEATAAPAAPAALTFSCSASPDSVAPGGKVLVTGTAMMLNSKTKPTYKFTSTGGRVIPGKGAIATITTRGVEDGDYTVTGHVSEGRKPGQSADCTATFSVDDDLEEEAETAPPPPPKPGDPTGDFLATYGGNTSKSVTIQPGGTATLKWDISSATSVALDRRRVPAKGQQDVSPTITTSYTLVATGKKGNNSLITTVTVNMPLAPGPEILSFERNPELIHRGEKATLTWRTKNVTSVTIDGVGTFDPSQVDHVDVSPTTQTKYVLKAQGEGGRIVYAPEVYVRVLP